MLFFVVLLAGPPLASLLMRHPRIHRALVARLEASFGRPVEVSNFTVSLLGGARVEANYVTVAEDPRFGHEFFLRADRITASLRWMALLSGRVEFGRLVLLRPSLNLVRNQAGQWNMIAWLPASNSPRTYLPAAPAPRLSRIEVATGRINFKRGADKHPFALVEMNGSFAQAAAGAWQLDLTAQPFRAGVPAQEPGEIRISGTVGGPRSRITPANLAMTWSQAAMADALRLLLGHDYRVRGAVAAEWHVQSSALESPSVGPWTFRGAVRLSGLHSVHLPSRSGDPSLSVRADLEWRPAQRRLELRTGLLEAAQSSIRASGQADWSGQPGATAVLRLASAGINFGDVLAFYRAFHYGVSAALHVDGNAGLSAEWRGWPLALHSLTMATDGARLRVPGADTNSAATMALGRAAVRFDPRRRRMDLGPALLSAVPIPSVRAVPSVAPLRMDGFFDAARGWRLDWNLGVQDWQAGALQSAAESLGLHFARTWRTAGWSLRGRVHARVKWQGTLWPVALAPSGSAEVREAVLEAPLLREPLPVAALRFDWGTATRIAVRDAQGWGGRWSGTIMASPGRTWDLDVRTSRMDTPVFHRWFVGPPETASASGSPTLLADARHPATLASARLLGSVVLSPQLPAPLFEALRPVDVSLRLALTAVPRRTWRLSGSLAAPMIEATTVRP